MAVPYHESTVFALPLREGGFALGVVARVSEDNSGGLLGYFFGPRFAAIPKSDIVSSLRPENALKVLRFGDLCLLNGEWQVIGQIPDWKAEEWPMPYFVRRNDLSKKAWRVLYSEKDVCEVVSEQPEPFDSTLDRDGTYGAGAVELLLTKLLA